MTKKGITAKAVSAKPKAARRKTFRHGDLRRTLMEAGLAMAAEGGPTAVSLREATRRAGVVPNAAYRHFTSQADLLAAVRSAALAALAVAIETRLKEVRPGPNSALYARRSLVAVGAGYLGFALGQPGLFRTAFSAPAPVFETPDPANAGESGLNPFELLGEALDRMVAAGVLAPANRPGAEFLAWASVHGLALLILDGPLQGIGPDQTQHFATRLLKMVEQGLS